MIGVLGDTLVVCTASAMIILLAGNGTAMCQWRHPVTSKSNGNADGRMGSRIRGFIVEILFAFSSIVANYIYAENNLVFSETEQYARHLAIANRYH